MKKRLLIAAVALVLCVAVVTTVLLTQTAVASNGILYRVSGPSGTAYLLGSLHIGTDAMYPFGDHITQAMEDSDIFVFESDSSDESTLELQARMFLPTGTSLRDILGDTRMDRVQDAYQTLGIRSDFINLQQPWVVISVLAVYATADEMGINNMEKGLSLGVDNTVEAYAKKHNKQLRYLESVTDYPDMMESFSPGLIDYLIDDELSWILKEEQTTQPSDMKDWPLYWQKGDAQSFWNSYSLSAGTADPQLIEEYDDKLLVQRNLRMAEQLDEMLADGGRYFVTVGLLHLIAPGSSIPDLLEQQGYTVERIEQ